MKNERLIKLRKNAKCTQAQMAEKLGVARSTYVTYELGTRQPDHKMLVEIADYFGVSVDYLLGRTDEPLDYSKPNLLAELTNPVLEHFDGDLNKACAFYEALKEDQKDMPLAIPEQFKDVMVAFQNGAENLTQQDVDAVVQFIEFLKNKNK